MTYCSDCEIYNECTKEQKDSENMFMCFARVRSLIIQNTLESDEFRQKVSDKVDEILSEKGNNDLGDYPGVIENQFDNMTGSMNL